MRTAFTTLVTGGLVAGAIAVTSGSAAVAETPPSNDAALPSVDIEEFAAQTSQRTLISIDPVRMADTRLGASTVDGLHAGEGRLDARSTYSIQIAGRAGVPIDAVGAVMNVTAVQPGGNGYLTVYACSDDRPLTSAGNYTTGVTLGNETFAGLSESGSVCVYTFEATDLTVDVVAHLPSSSTLVPVTPTRLLETRPGLQTVDGEGAGAGRTTPGETTTVEVSGRAGLPAGIDAVLVNVAAVAPTASGFVQTHACLPEPPTSSSLNYVDGVNRSNEILVDVDGNGRFCVETSTDIHLVVDVVAYVLPGSSIRPTLPIRLADTRASAATVDDRFEADGRRAAGSEYRVEIAGRGAIPTDATAAIVNLAGVNPSDVGFLTAHPCLDERPNTAALNYTTGVNGANEIIAPLDASGATCIYTSAPIDLVLDGTGYVTNIPETVATADLVITLSDSTDPVVQGDTFTYTVEITNDGPDAATGVTVMTAMPNGVTVDATSGCAEDPTGVPGCTIGSLAVGATRQFTVSVTASSAPVGTITAEAAVMSDLDDPDTTDNTATETTAVAAPNTPPTPTNATITYEAIGNTLLRVDGPDADGHDTPLPGRIASTVDTTDALTKAAPTDSDSAAVTFVAGTLTSAEGGSLTIDDDGDFFYLPPAGFEGADSVEATLTDGDGGTAPVTIAITVTDVVWYVEDTVDAAKNPGTDDTGRSTNAFQSLAGVEAASGPDDYILVMETDAPLEGAISLKSGQKLYGQAVEEDSPSRLPAGLLLEEIADTNARPEITSNTSEPTVAIRADTASGDLTGVEIRHLSIDSDQWAVFAVTLNDTNLDVGFSDLTLSSGPSHQSLSAIDFSSGTVTVTDLSDIEVVGDGSRGILLEQVIFDADLEAAGTQPVDGGDTTIGSTSARVVGNGLQVNSAQGSLVFGNVDVASTSGFGLRATSFPGGTFTLDTDSGNIDAVDSAAVSLVGIIAGQNVGDVMELTSVTASKTFGVSPHGMRLSDVSGGFTVTGPTSVTVPSGAPPGTRFSNGIVIDDVSAAVELSGTTTVSGTELDGVDVDGLTGSLSIPAASSSITDTSSSSSVVPRAAFNVHSSSGSITYAGSITDVSARSVAVTEHGGVAPSTVEFTGPITDSATGILVDDNDQGAGANVSFSGGLDLQTGAETAFTATNGGTVTVTGTGNTISTTTGTAVDIQNTTIGAAGVTFDSIDVADPTATVGINLDTTGTTGFFEVTGDGPSDPGASTVGRTTIGAAGLIAPGSGGTIVGVDGIVLNAADDVRLRNMVIGNAARLSSDAVSTETAIDDNGIESTDVDGLLLDNVLISDTGDHGIEGFGTNTGLTLRHTEILNAGDDGGAGSDDAIAYRSGADVLVGSAAIESSILAGMADTGLAIENASGDLDLTVSNSLIGRNHHNIGCTPCEGDGMFLRADGGGATIDLVVTDTTFDGVANDGIDIGNDQVSNISTLIAERVSGVNNTDADNLIDLTNTSGDFEARITDITSDADHQGTVLLFEGLGAGSTDVTVDASGFNRNLIAGSATGNGIDVIIDGDAGAGPTDGDARISISHTDISNHFNAGIGLVARGMATGSESAGFLDVTLDDISTNTPTRMDDVIVGSIEVTAGQPGNGALQLDVRNSIFGFGSFAGGIHWETIQLLGDRIIDLACMNGGAACTGIGTTTGDPVIVADLLNENGNLIYAALISQSDVYIDPSLRGLQGTVGIIAPSDVSLPTLP